MRKIGKAEIYNLFSEKAKRGAMIVCGEGQCFGCFDCGHLNKADQPVARVGKGNVCPVAGYNVQPDNRSFIEKLNAGEGYDPEKDSECLFAVCACCEHATVTENGGRYTLHRSSDDYRNYCLDCPVNMCMESMQETTAEAAMS